jgi:hypothetical protein
LFFEVFRISIFGEFHVNVLPGLRFFEVANHSVKGPYKDDKQNDALNDNHSKCESNLFFRIFVFKLEIRIKKSLKNNITNFNSKVDIIGNFGLRGCKAHTISHENNVGHEHNDYLGLK